MEAEIRQLEKENSRLEIGYRQETNRAEDLAKKLEEAEKVGLCITNQIPKMQIGYTMLILTKHKSSNLEQITML